MSRNSDNKNSSWGKNIFKQGGDALKSAFTTTRPQLYDEEGIEMSELSGTNERERNIDSKSQRQPKQKEVEQSEQEAERLRQEEREKQQERLNKEKQAEEKEQVFAEEGNLFDELEEGNLFDNTEEPEISDQDIEPQGPYQNRQETDISSQEQPESKLHDGIVESGFVKRRVEEIEGRINQGQVSAPQKQAAERQRQEQEAEYIKDKDSTEVTELSFPESAQGNTNLNLSPFGIAITKDQMREIQELINNQSRNKGVGEVRGQDSIRFQQNVEDKYSEIRWHERSSNDAKESHSAEQESLATVNDISKEDVTNILKGILEYSRGLAPNQREIIKTAINNPEALQALFQQSADQGKQLSLEQGTNRNNQVGLIEDGYQFSEVSKNVTRENHKTSPDPEQKLTFSIGEGDDNSSLQLSGGNDGQNKDRTQIVGPDRPIGHTKADEKNKTRNIEENQVETKGFFKSNEEQFENIETEKQRQRQQRAAAQQRRREESAKKEAERQRKQEVEQQRIQTEERRAQQSRQGKERALERDRARNNKAAGLMNGGTATQRRAEWKKRKARSEKHDTEKQTGIDKDTGQELDQNGLMFLLSMLAASEVSKGLGQQKISRKQQAQKDIDKAMENNAKKDAEAATKVQSLFRGHQARQKASKLRKEQRAATSIQRGFREIRRQQRVAEAQRAVERREAAEAAERQAEAAATSIQRGFRGFRRQQRVAAERKRQAEAAQIAIDQNRSRNDRLMRGKGRRKQIRRRKPEYQNQRLLFAAFLSQMVNNQSQQKISRKQQAQKDIDKAMENIAKKDAESAKEKQRRAAARREAEKQAAIRIQNFARRNQARDQLAKLRADKASKLRQEQLEANRDRLRNKEGPAVTANQRRAASRQRAKQQGRDENRASSRAAERQEQRAAAMGRQEARQNQTAVGQKGQGGSDRRPNKKQQKAEEKKIKDLKAKKNLAKENKRREEAQRAAARRRREEAAKRKEESKAEKRAEEATRREQKKQAAIRIQNFARRNQARDQLAKLRADKAKKERVATKVQSAFRGRRARDDYKAIKDATIKTQSLYRGKQARQEASKLRQEQRAATSIQRGFREVRRQQAERRQEAATKVQSAFRGFRVRQEAKQQGRDENPASSRAAARRKQEERQNLSQKLNQDGKTATKPDPSKTKYAKKKRGERDKAKRKERERKDVGISDFFTSNEEQFENIEAEKQAAVQQRRREARDVSEKRNPNMTGNPMHSTRGGVNISDSKNEKQSKEGKHAKPQTTKPNSLNIGYKGEEARRAAEERQKRVATTLQSIARGKRARRYVEGLRQEKAATKIQSAFRGFRVRQQAERKKQASATKVQSLFRGHQARQQAKRQRRFQNPYENGVYNVLQGSTRQQHTEAIYNSLTNLNTRPPVGKRYSRSRSKPRKDPENIESLGRVAAQYCQGANFSQEKQIEILQSISQSEGKHKELLKDDKHRATLVASFSRNMQLRVEDSSKILDGVIGRENVSQPHIEELAKVQFKNSDLQRGHAAGFLSQEYSDRIDQQTFLQNVSRVGTKKPTKQFVLGYSSSKNHDDISQVEQTVTDLTSSENEKDKLLNSTLDLTNSSRRSQEELQTQFQNVKERTQDDLQDLRFTEASSRISIQNTAERQIFSRALQPSLDSRYDLTDPEDRKKAAFAIGALSSEKGFSAESRGRLLKDFIEHPSKRNSNDSLSPEQQSEIITSFVSGSAEQTSKDFAEVITYASGQNLERALTLLQDSLGLSRADARRYLDTNFRDVYSNQSSAISRAGRALSGRQSKLNLRVEEAFNKKKSEFDTQRDEKFQDTKREFDESIKKVSSSRNLDPNFVKESRKQIESGKEKGTDKEKSTDKEKAADNEKGTDKEKSADKEEEQRKENEKSNNLDQINSNLDGYMNAFKFVIGFIGLVAAGPIVGAAAFMVAYTIEKEYIKNRSREQEKNEQKENIPKKGMGIKQKVKLGLSYGLALAVPPIGLTVLSAQFLGKASEYVKNKMRKKRKVDQSLTTPDRIQERERSEEAGRGKSVEMDGLQASRSTEHQQEVGQQQEVESAISATPDTDRQQQRAAPAAAPPRPPQEAEAAISATPDTDRQQQRADVAADPPKPQQEAEAGPEKAQQRAEQERSTAPPRQQQRADVAAAAGSARSTAPPRQQQIAEPAAEPEKVQNKVGQPQIAEPAAGRSTAPQRLQNKVGQPHEVKKANSIRNTLSNRKSVARSTNVRSTGDGRGRSNSKGSEIGG